MEEDRARLTRTQSTQQTQIDKYKRLADDAKSKADSTETQLQAVKKVCCLRIITKEKYLVGFHAVDNVLFGLINT